MSVEKTPEEKRQEAEQMQNVLLLLNHLIESEETTVKLIIDCLYEVGTVNLINQKVSSRQVNVLARRIAGLSKPAAKVFALRWFKKNCPALIVKWLHSKVSFKAVAPKKVVPSITETPPSDQSASVRSQPVSNTPAPVSHQPVSARRKPVTVSQPLTSDTQLQEIQQLQGKVKILSGLLACAMVALGGTTAWQVYQVGTETSQATPIFQPVTGFSED